MQSWIFSIITPDLSVTLSFRNHSNLLIWCLIVIHFIGAQLLVVIIIINVEKPFLLLYFMEADTFFQDSLFDS